MEGRLVDLMESLSEAFPAATLFSLPTFAEAGRRRSVELGMKGPRAQVEAAMAHMREEIERRGYEWEDKR